MHPWIFSGAIAQVDGAPVSGDLVKLVSQQGEFLGVGHYSQASQIRVRLLERGEVTIDTDWWRKKLQAAIENRRSLSDSACRLINAESDYLPGLIVDRYGDFLVLQALTAGIDRIKAQLAGQLLELLPQIQGVYERSDVEVRKLEGLPFCNGVLLGDNPPERLKIQEGEYQFWVEIKTGQKTGFFLDQRTNRKSVAQYASGRDVLDGFCYSGGFAVSVLRAGAKSLTAVDSSANALELAKENLKLNNLDSAAVELVEDNAFQLLRKFRDRGRSFDMVILDPPKLAPTRAHVQKATRAYKDINLLALKLLNPGGILVTFSCSAGIDANLFKEILRWAAQDAGREAQILNQLSQDSDHPIRLSFPESEYLKGLILRVS
ncbi:MAG: class I SAM-dependent rRNA methyltransferase [Candidatus Schekmanbacteria bacterium]|nr:class I SAM-dependent rRNA methyltransferase [Candidatus Schekmanbacteria bacterium]